ncbi:hypothetical protein F5X99DRAFT_365050 [Biscogniauxia marginata]|nr:hypothetical protein F5X99DRAFT_365050 [Biscogniauxia marginata]
MTEVGRTTTQVMMGDTKYSIHTRNISQLTGDTEIPLSYGKAQGSRSPPMFDRDRPKYKPSAPTWPFLAAVLVVILVLIGLVAYALHALPVLDMETGVLSRSLHVNESKGEVRTEPGTAISDSSPGAGTTDASPTMAPAQVDYGDVGTPYQRQPRGGTMET